MSATDLTQYSVRSMPYNLLQIADRHHTSLGRYHSESYNRHCLLCVSRDAGLTSDIETRTRPTNDENA